MVSRRFSRTDPVDPWPETERVDPYKAAHGHAYLHNATVDRTDILREQYNDLYQRFIRMIWSFAVIILVQFFATVFVIVLLVNKLS